MALTIKIYGYNGNPAGGEERTIQFAVRDRNEVTAKKRFGQLKANLAVISEDSGAAPRHAMYFSVPTQPDIRLFVIDELQNGNSLYVWFVAWGVKKNHPLDTDDLTVTIETVNTTIVTTPPVSITLSDV